MSVPFLNTSPGVLLFNALQCLAISGMYNNETDNPMEYSKFSVAKSLSESSTVRVPSKIGMLIIYVPATIVAFGFQLIHPQILLMNHKPTAAGWLVLAHFMKRDIEVLFLHKYSGDVELNTARMIGFSYAVYSFVICLLSNPYVSGMSLDFAVFLFIVGALGNFYHHYLLAELRSQGNSEFGTKEYKAPHGGFFEYVAAPHYLFELIAWFGIAVASQQMTTYLVLVSMTCYLSARANNQNKWNKKKFEERDWPSSRKNLIPFLY